MNDATTPTPGADLPVVGYCIRESDQFVWATGSGRPFARKWRAVCYRDDAQSALAALRADLDRKSDAIQRLWRERDEALAENARLVREADSARVEFMAAIQRLSDSMKALADDRDSWREQADARTADALRFANELTALKASMPDIEAVKRLIEALEKIDAWSRAYPLDVFPEPTAEQWAQLHEAAKAFSPGIDRFSASNMRHVVNGIGETAREALRRSLTEGAGSGGEGRS